jgi:glycosyltransferase involved in cell wall biosynthesis
LLFLPGPVHGASLNGRLIADYFKNTDQIINIGISRNINDIGRFRFYKIIDFISILFKLVYVCTYHRPSLCYMSHTVRGNGFFRDLAFIFVLKIFRIRILYHVHNCTTRFEGYSTFALQYIYGNSSIIWLSERLKIREVEKTVSRSYILSNSSDFVVDSYFFRPQLKRVIYLSNFYQFKGIDTVLEVILACDKCMWDLDFILIGADGDVGVGFIEEKIKNLQYVRVTVLQGLAREDVSKCLRESDLMIYPTRDDAMPLTVLEGIQHGLPVLTCDVGAIRDMVVDKYNGLILENESDSFLQGMFFYKKAENLREHSRNSYEHFKMFHDSKTYCVNLKRIFEDEEI